MADSTEDWKDDGEMTPEEQTWVATATSAMLRAGADSHAAALLLERRAEVIAVLDEHLLRFCIMCGCGIPDAAHLQALSCCRPCRAARQRLMSKRGGRPPLPRSSEHLPIPNDPRDFLRMGLLDLIAHRRAAAFEATWNSPHPTDLRSYLSFLKRAKTAAARRRDGTRQRQRDQIADVMADLYPDAFVWSDRFGRWQRIRGALQVEEGDGREGDTINAGGGS
jgi:hypothetical protein